MVPVLFSGLSVFLLWALFLNHDTDKEFFYPTLAAAEGDGAVYRHWLPDFLPQSSRNIHVAGDMSPSRTWCAFEFIPSDSELLQKHLRKVDVLVPEVKRVPSPGKRWWPIVLTGTLDPGKIQQVGFELHLTEEPANQVNTVILLFAIDPRRGRAFVYTTYLSDSSESKTHRVDQ